MPGSPRIRPQRSSFRTATLVLGVLGALLLAGCAKRTDASAGELVRISQRNEPSDLDPATASLPDEFFIIRALSEGLLVPNPNGGAPLPGAATHYDVSPDQLTYTFHLRPGAIWSNGEPVTAEDFVWSLRRVLTASTGSPKAHLLFAVKNAREFLTGKITDFAAVGIHADDPTTLVVTLAQPTPNFPLYVASGPWIPVNPRVVQQFGRTWTAPAHHVGNGPYVLDEWKPEQRITVRRNARYHDAAHLRVATLQFVRFDSADTEERAFRAGEVDVTMAVPQSKLDVYAQQQPAELMRTPLAETRFIAFNTHRAPLTDPRVRRALSLAIDRDRLVRDVLRGGQQPAYRFLSQALSDTIGSPTTHADTTTDASTLTFNPAEARRLLAAAGFPEGRGFPTLELAGWVQNPVLEAVQQMWRRELGINVRIVVQEAKVHLSALNAGNYDLAFVTNLLDVRDPAAALEDFTSAAPNNFPHWASPGFDTLVRTAAAERDPRQRAAEIAAAERLLLADAPVAPIYFNVQNWLKSPRVHGWEQDALWSRRYNDLRIESGGIRTP